MAAIPPIPAFPFQSAPTLLTLNQLASCVSFIYKSPALCSLSGSGQTLSTGAATALTWTTGTDRDGGHSNSVNPTRYTAQTPGYYDLSLEVAFASNATGNREAHFRITTGPNNPAGAGQTTAFGQVATIADGSSMTVVETAFLSPYMWAGDYVEALGMQASGGNLATNNCQWQIVLVSLGP